MHVNVKNPHDFWCAIFFVAFGAVAMYLSHSYEMGSALDMGPGYFPMWLGGILVAFGLVMGAAAFRAEGTETEDLSRAGWAFRPWLVLPAALFVFAALMEAGAGFVPSLFLLIVGCALAHKDVRWMETLLLAVLLTAAAVAIFVYGIELPYRLFWWSD